MRLNLLYLGALLASCLLLGSCANTNTPTGQAIAAGLQQQSQMRAMGASAAPQRTGMQEFFAGRAPQ